MGWGGEGQKHGGKGPGNKYAKQDDRTKQWSAQPHYQPERGRDAWVHAALDRANAMNEKFMQREAAKAEKAERKSFRASVTDCVADVLGLKSSKPEKKGKKVRRSIDKKADKSNAPFSFLRFAKGRVLKPTVSNESSSSQSSNGSSEESKSVSFKDFRKAWANMQKNKGPKKDKTKEQLKTMIPMMQQMMGQSKGDDFGEQDEMMKLLQGEDPEKEEMTNMMQTMMQSMMKMKDQKTQKNNEMESMMQKMLEAMNSSSGSAGENPMAQMIQAMAPAAQKAKPKKLILEAGQKDGDATKTDVPEGIKEVAKKIIPDIDLDSMPEVREEWIKEFVAMEGVTQAKLNEILALNSLSTTTGRDKGTKVRQLIAAVEP